MDDTLKGVDICIYVVRPIKAQLILTGNQLGIDLDEDQNVDGKTKYEEILWRGKFINEE